MKEFTYTIKDKLGIHARPAGQLGKLAKSFAGTTVMVTKEGKSVKAAQVIKLMSLGVKHGDTVTVTAEGEDEEKVLAALQAFFEENL